MEETKSLWKTYYTGVHIYCRHTPLHFRYIKQSTTQILVHKILENKGLLQDDLIFLARLEGKDTHLGGPEEKV